MGAQTTYYGGALVAKQDNLVKVDMPALMPVAQLPNPMDLSFDSGATTGTGSQ